MEFLKSEILPLFEITRKTTAASPNDLIRTGLNTYELYVELGDIYHKRSQSHQIESFNQEMIEYTIPLQYHEIVLRGKGAFYENVTINIYSLRHLEYLRINTSDLFLYKKLSEEQWSQEKYEFEHLSGDKITIELDQSKNQSLSKISDQGLPVPRSDHLRGNLYIWLIKENETDDSTNNEVDLLLEMLNYHPNSNVTIPN